MKPQEITDLEIAFPANVDKLMPPQASIPEDFVCGRTFWNKLFHHIFFYGADLRPLKAKTDVDKQLALRHLRAVMGSFEPKHEHKESASAYLLSLWFELPDESTQADMLVTK